MHNSNNNNNNNYTYKLLFHAHTKYSSSVTITKVLSADKQTFSPNATAKCKVCKCKYGTVLVAM